MFHFLAEHCADNNWPEAITSLGGFAFLAAVFWVLFK